MRLGDGVKIKGVLTIFVHDHGHSQKVVVPNTVTSNGLGLIVDVLRGQGSALAQFAVGTNSATPVPGNTRLGTQVHRSDITQQTNQGAGALRVQYFLGSQVANGNILREAGIYNEVGDILFSRAVHGAITKTVNVTLTYQWNFTISG